MTKQQLIDSKEFQDALIAGAEVKRDMMLTQKQKRKALLDRFNGVMLASRPDIQQILKMKKKQRTDSDNELLKKFKQNVSQTYSQVRDFMTPEEVDEGKQTKVEKIVSKLATVVDMLRYAGCDVLDKALVKYGLAMTSLNELPDHFNAAGIKDEVKDIFSSAVALKKSVDDSSTEINETIFQQKVPTDLRYDKKLNNAGLKQGDFRKLVDMQAKLLSAQTDEAKEKVEEKIEHAASDKQFEVARAELVRDKLTKLQ